MGLETRSKESVRNRKNEIQWILGEFQAKAGWWGWFLEILRIQERRKKGLGELARPRGMVVTLNSQEASFPSTHRRSRRGVAPFQARPRAKVQAMIRIKHQAGEVDQTQFIFWARHYILLLSEFIRTILKQSASMKLSSISRSTGR